VETERRRNNHSLLVFLLIFVHSMDVQGIGMHNVGVHGEGIYNRHINLPWIDTDLYNSLG
jgi:hypothetical protein